MYLPKSKYSIKNTSGGELIYKSDNKPYIGEYILTSKTKYYAGTNNINLGSELIPLKISDLLKENQRGSSKDVRKHTIFRPDIDDFLKQVILIPHEKPKPTEEEYKKGVFTRYFVKKINIELYMEISSETFSDLKKKKPKYDYNLYEAGSLNWDLRGNVFKKNTINIKVAQKLFRTINHFFHKLDEYRSEEKLLQTHLYTGGNELYFDNGAEYIGKYHITPTGPMVGSTHTKEFHPKLYYSKKPPISTSSSGKISGY